MVLSNTFDTTAFQDETVEDFIRNNNGSKETHLTMKKSNHLEMKVMNRIPPKNQPKRAFEDGLEHGHQVQKVDETESVRGENEIQDEYDEKEQIEDEKEFNQLLQTPVTDNMERNLVGNKTGLNSNRGSRCSEEEEEEEEEEEDDDDDDDEHGEGKNSVYIEMEKRCKLQNVENVASQKEYNNNNYTNDHPKTSIVWKSDPLTVKSINNLVLVYLSTVYLNNLILMSNGLSISFSIGSHDIHLDVSWF